MAKRMLLVGIAVLAISVVAQAAISGGVIKMIDVPNNPVAGPFILLQSLYPHFNNPAYLDWMVSETNGTFTSYEQMANVEILDQSYGQLDAVKHAGLLAGGGAAVPGTDYWVGSHNGVGEPCTYSDFPVGQGGLTAVNRPSLAWTWPAVGTTAITLGTKLINLPETGRLEWYFNHGDGGYTHAWTATRYDASAVVQESAAWNVTSADYAMIKVGVDFSGAQAGDYVIVEMTGGNPVWHAMGVVPEPATLALLTLGGVALIRRRSR